MAICTPSVECQQLRLNSQFCPGPQGEYEPYPCPQGHYCPDAATVRQCPANHYCPVGTVHPIPCNGFALCPAGTVRQTQIIPVVTVAGFDILALLLIFAYQRVCACERQKSECRKWGTPSFRLRCHSTTAASASDTGKRPWRTPARRGRGCYTRTAAPAEQRLRPMTRLPMFFPVRAIFFTHTAVLD